MMFAQPPSEAFCNGALIVFLLVFVGIPVIKIVSGFYNAVFHERVNAITPSNYPSTGFGKGGGQVIQVGETGFQVTGSAENYGQLPGQGHITVTRSHRHWWEPAMEARAEEMATQMDRLPSVPTQRNYSRNHSIPQQEYDDSVAVEARVRELPTMPAASSSPTAHQETKVSDFPQKNRGPETWAQPDPGPYLDWPGKKG